MKEKFIKSTIILIIGGFFTKILSLLIRIIATRIVGLKGIGLFMLVLPTFNLFVTIATLSLPLAISKLVAENSRNNKNLILNILPIALIFNILIIILLFLTAPFIANNLLKNSDLYYPIIAVGLTLPFITISSIIKGYFFGKENMTPNVISSISEQIARIIIIILITPILLKNGIIYAVTGLVLFNITSEIISIIVLLLFLPKRSKIKKEDLKINKKNIRDIFNISIPTTISRLISSIGLFLEPIIITYVFLKIGKDNNYITNEYGIMSGYVIPMVTMPSFLCSAIANALLPVITKYYELKKYILIKRKLKQAIFFSLLIGIPCSVILFLFPEFFLNFIFKTNLGINYLKVASLIFLISYIEGPMISALQAMNKSKTVMICTITSIIIKTILLYLFTLLNIGLYSLLFAELVQFIFITIYMYIAIKKLI